jgi:pimeloyl-ACP methyl ester carboxylesterase
MIASLVQRLVFLAALLSPHHSPNASQQRAPEPSKNLQAVLPVPPSYVQIFGQRIAFYESGPRRAETIILLPNLGWDSHSWAQNFSVLSREYHVIAIDPLGFGLSSKPLLDYKMDTWTDMLAEFLRVRGIPRATFAGAVMGGALSVQMALDHPDRVGAIIVAASNSGPGPQEGGMARIPSEPSLAGTRANLLALFHDSALVTDALVRARFAFRLRTNDGYTIQRHLADHRAPYTREELSRIKVPALVVWCRQDRVTPLLWGERYAEALPHGKLVTLEGCGHMPNLEQPAAFNGAVLDFMHSRKAGSTGR